MVSQNEKPHSHSQKGNNMNQYPDEVMNKEDAYRELKYVKKMIFKQELLSFMFAFIFASNLASVICFPPTFMTVINAGIALLILKRFKPTVKQQFLLHTYLDTLKGQIKKNKWKKN